MNRNRAMGLHALLALILSATLLPVTAGAPAAAATAKAESADPVSRDVRITGAGNTSLAATITGQAPLAARPTVVEFTPYGEGQATLEVGPDYNYLLVQMRGTGDSDGRFDAIGPGVQADVAEALAWACEQPWSNGRLALSGFSASAIAVYNSLHLELPCVETAVLRSGTFDLYRDLLAPGGVPNLAPGVAVLAAIGAPALAQGFDRAQRNPASIVDAFLGLFSTGLDAGLLHPTLDSFWQQRRFRGDANDLPVLMVNSFFDVESRGAFQAFQELRDDGAHLLLEGGHDGAPAGTDNGQGEIDDWLDHHLRDVDNGIEDEPAVRLLLADGDREDLLAGDYVEYDAADWPVPGTTWSDLRLSSARSGTALSLNDGSLTLGNAGRRATQSYLSLPSLLTATDPFNTAVVGAAGLNMLSNALPILTDMTLAEPLGLTYTTPPLSEDVLAAGPAALEIPLSTTSPETAIWAVLSDVSPDGVAHPLTVGRLHTAFPDIDVGRSLRDADGDVVQPYGDYSTKRRAGLLQTRRYQVEFWPVGNRFQVGHRIRLQIVGASAASLPTIPALNSVRVGGSDGAVLRFPVLPESDLADALGGG